MAAEQELPLVFPQSGLDVSAEYSRQPPGTCPDASNVRTYDPLLERRRGGSRPGLEKLVGQLNGTALIQHLAVLVDPTTEALSANDPLDDAIPDPNTNFPNRVIPTEGSGVQLNRNVDGEGPASIAFVQAKREQPGNINTTYTVTLDSQPGLNNLIVVFIRTEKATTAGLVSSVTNENLNAFTQAGPGGDEEAIVTTGGVAHMVTAFWRVADAGAPDQEIRITPGSLATYEIIVIEYSGADENSPVSNFAKVEQTANTTPCLIGPLSMNGTSGQAVAAALICTDGAVLSEIAAGYTRRGSPSNLVAMDKTGISGAGDENPGFTPSSSDPYVGVALALTV